MSQEISQNKTDQLGTGPLAKLLVGMCIPPMFGYARSGIIQYCRQHLHQPD